MCRDIVCLSTGIHRVPMRGMFYLTGKSVFSGTKSDFLLVNISSKIMDHWSNLTRLYKINQWIILTSIKLVIAAWRVITNVSRDFQNSDSVLGRTGRVRELN